MNSGLIIVLAAIGIILIWTLLVYNQLVSLKNMAKNAFSNIDVMLKKRYDLIPSLVNTVKGYMKHERETFEQLTKLRQQAIQLDAGDNTKVDLNNKISELLGNVMVSVEAYPDLKASDNFLHLQRSMAEIEEQLSASRRSYNMAVTELNTKTETIPSNLVAQLFKFKRKPLFQATATERKVADVQL